MQISKEVTFDAAHFLPDHPGKCKYIHGHTYRVRVTVEGPVDPKTGMVVDFSVLEESLRAVVDLLDHRLINEVRIGALREGPPTAENIARVIWGIVEEGLSPKVSLVEVRVWETPGSFVSFQGK